MLIALGLLVFLVLGFVFRHALGEPRRRAAILPMAFRSSLMKLADVEVRKPSPSFEVVASPHWQHAGPPRPTVLVPGARPGRQRPSPHRAQESAAKFVCGERWLTFEPVGLTEPPLKDVDPITDQVWTIRKAELLHAFVGFDNGPAYLSTHIRGKTALIYVAPERYWWIPKCLG